MGRQIYKLRQDVPVSEQTFYVLDRGVLEVSKENKNVFWEDVFKKMPSKLLRPTLKEQ